jgi:hypothetical protein
MAAGAGLPGRSGLVALFNDVLRRDGVRDLPLMVLFGPRGSGKTWALKYIGNACRQSAAIPHAFVDCEERRYSVWQLVGKLADELHGPWPEFGTVDFRRVWLARVAVAIPDLPEDDEAARNRMLAELRARVGLAKRADAAGEIVSDATQLPHAAQALDISPGELKFVGRLVGRFVTSAINSRYTVERLFQTGLTWYADRAKRTGTGLAELVRLNRLSRSADSRREADRIIVAAFLADIEGAFSRRRRRFNGAILLDNCHEEAGRELLNHIAQARAMSVDCDPVVVLATARTLPELIGLRDRWPFPWETRKTSALLAGDRAGLPTTATVDYSRWRTRRGGRESPGGWWLPIHLQDLTPTELAGVVPDEAVRFVHGLTLGHPWSARRLRDILPVASSRRAILDQFDPEYLLRELSDRHRELRRWAAARDIDAAANALGGRGSDLPDRLETSLWLIAPESPLKWPRIHPWLRRILLRQLAGEGPGEWQQVHHQLRDWAKRNRPLDVDVPYHSLACEELDVAVDHLIEQLRSRGSDADTWITRFDETTSAPGLHRRTESAEARYDELLDRCPEASGVRRVVWSLVAARWIWADPLGDPEFSLAHTIANEFVRLADDFVESGRNQFHRQARKYREMRP